MLAVEVKTSGVGFRAMVPVMAQEMTDPIRTVLQRAAANLDPKTRRVSCVKVCRGAGGCVFTAVECELAKHGNYGVWDLFEAAVGLLCSVSQTALFTNYEIAGSRIIHQESLTDTRVHSKRAVSRNKTWRRITVLS